MTTRKKLSTMIAAVAGTAALLGPAAFATSASAQNPGVESIRICQAYVNNAVFFRSEYVRTGQDHYQDLANFYYIAWMTNCNF